MANTFTVSVVTPERAVLETEARFVALPAHDGELGILRDRAPLMVKLAAGRLRVDAADGEQLFFIGGGFAEMAANRLTILTEEARRPDELERGAAEAALEEARAMAVLDDASFEKRQRALGRARAQLRMLR